MLSLVTISSAIAILVTFAAINGQRQETAPEMATREPKNEDPISKLRSRCPECYGSGIQIFLLPNNEGIMKGDCKHCFGFTIQDSK